MDYRRNHQRAICSRIAALVFVIASASACSTGEEYLPRNGDIIFHESRSAQSRAIQLATGSRYSHMGLVVLREGETLVFEAVQPVKATPLDEWIARGNNGHFVVKRLQNADRILDPEKLRKMLAVGETLIGRDYDRYFEWSDDRIYCSELVWKVYQRGAGIAIGQLEQMRDFDFSHPLVQANIRERFSDGLALEDTVISPAAIFDAPDLETVYRN